MSNTSQEQRKDTKDVVKNLTKHQLVLLSEANKLHKNGFWVVPTVGKISKSKNDKNTRLSYSDFKQLVIDKNCNGLGILTNELTDYLSFDLDTKDATNPQLFKRRLLFELDNYPTLKSKIKLSESPSGGYHLYISTTDKKSFIGAFAWSEYSNDNKQKQTITGRSLGQYCCEFPTKNYQWIIDNDLQELTQQDKSDLNDIFRVLNEDKTRFERIEQERKERFKKQLELRDKKVYTDSDSNIEIAVWDDFNNRNTVDSILIKNGFNFKYTHGDKDYYLRDGSTSKSSGFVENNRYVNFSDNAGLPTKIDGGSGRKFRAYDLVVHLNYNSDYSIAAKDLISHGYGKFKEVEKSNVNGFKSSNKTIKDSFLGYEVKRFELSKTQYISNVYTDNLKEQNLMFVGGCGLGKTVLTNSYDNSIITSFLTTTVNNYANEGFNVFNGSAINYDISDVFGANKNATTFQSLRTVYDAKKSQFDNVEIFYNSFVLIIDEFQQMLTEMYANKAIYTAFEVIKEHVANGGKLRLLTANELIFEFDFLSDLKIKHFVKDVILKPCFVYSFDSKKKIETAAKFVNTSDSRNRKILALTNRTEKHNDNIELQKLTGSKALNLDSNNKNDFDFRNGLESSVYATTALSTGVNIYEKNTDCAIFEYNDFTQIPQFYGRLRYKNLENFYTKSNSYTLFRNFDFNEKSLNYNECLELSQRHLKSSIQNAKNDIQFCITLKMTTNKSKNGSNVRWNNKLNIAEIDYIKINQKNHSYLNTLLHSNKDAFVIMMKRQGYDVTFLEYDYDIDSVIVEVVENEFKGFLTALKLTILDSIKKICLDGSEVKMYKNKDFEYWFRYFKNDNETIKNLYFDFKELNKILNCEKLAFESLFLTDNITKIGKRKTTDCVKLVDSKKTVKRFAFAAAYYESDSLKFQSIVSELTSNQFTLNSIIDLFLTMNKDYDIKIFKNTDKHTAAGLTASLGVVLELKKYFGNDLVSIVRKTIKASLTDSNTKKTGASLIKVLSNHFKTNEIIENRLKSYCFEIVCKDSVFLESE